MLPLDEFFVCSMAEKEIIFFPMAQKKFSLDLMSRYRYYTLSNKGINIQTGSLLCTLEIIDGVRILIILYYVRKKRTNIKKCPTVMTYETVSVYIKLIAPTLSKTPSKHSLPTWSPKSKQQLISESLDLL